MPRVAVILPVHNEAWLIGSVLGQVTDFARSHPDWRFQFVDDGSSADRFLAVLAIAAAIEIIAVAMVGAIRFRGPITTRTTPASPTAPYSAVVDLDRGRE